MARNIKVISIALVDPGRKNVKDKDLYAILQWTFTGTGVEAMNAPNEILFTHPLAISQGQRG